MEFIILVAGSAALVGFAVGSFLLVPVPFVAVLVVDMIQGPPNPDDDISPIVSGVAIVFGTAGVLLGVLVRKAVRRARRLTEG